MKGKDIFINFVIWIIIVLASLLTFINLTTKKNGVTYFFGYVPINVKHDSMSPTIKNGDYIIFTEPDFCFEVNCSLKWIVSLWHEGCLCGNEFSTPLDKEQAEKLRDYLREIIEVKNDNNS